VQAQEWTVDVTAPQEQVYAVVDELVLGTGGPLPRVRSVRVLSPTMALWTIDGPMGPLEVTLLVRDRRPFQSIAALANGKGIRVSGRIDLEELDAGGTRCRIALGKSKLPFLLDALAGPLVAREHDRIGREIARFLEEKAKPLG